MKQAMIVLTLWMLSQNAHSQSVKLEEYAHGDAVYVSARHPNAMINRQTMADINPYSLPVKTETPAAAAHQKARTDGALDNANREEVKALWANTKALDENTRALEENTKALKENTEMMRALLQAGYYRGGAAFAAQQAEEQRYQSAVVRADQPAPFNPLFSGYRPEMEMPSTAANAKPQMLLASASSMPATRKPTAYAAEPVKTIPANNATAKTTTPATAPAKSEKQEIETAGVSKSAGAKPATIMAAPARIAAKPHTCSLHLSASDGVEAEIMQPVPAAAAAMPRAWAASAAMKPQMPKLKTTVTARQMPTANAVSKKPTQTTAAAPAPLKMVAATKTPAANSAPKPQVHKAVMPITAKMPVVAAATKTPDHKSRPGNVIPASTAAKPKALAAKAAVKPQAPKPAMPVAGSKMQLAGAMTTAAKHTKLPANPIPAIAPASTKPVASAAVKPQMPRTITTAAPKAAPVNVVVKTAKPANIVSAKAAEGPKMIASAAPVKPKAANIPVPAAKPVVSNTHTTPASLAAVVVTASKSHPVASLAPVTVTGAKSHHAAASHSTEKLSPTGKLIASARSGMSVEIVTGMLGKNNKRVSLGYLLQFPLLDRAFDNQMRNTSHLPTDVYSGFKEGDVITTHGYINLIAIEDSGTKNETYYMQLVVNPYRKDSCLNVRITADQFAGDARKKLTENARLFVREQLLNGNAPTHSGNVMQRPVFVSITGQLVYNSALAGAMRGPHPLYIGKKGVRSYTPWEISNVNRIQFTR